MAAFPSRPFAMTLALALLAACSPAPVPADGDAVATARPVESAESPAPAPVAATTATLRGTLTFPAEALPPMRVCAINGDDPGDAVCRRTAAGTDRFELQVTPGRWWLLAWPEESADGEPGLHSVAGPCLAAADGTACTDHALVDVVVAAGDVRDGLDITDWYYDPREFPPPMAPWDGADVD